MILLLLFSFFAGMITILAPCILSILPILLSTTTTARNNYTSLGIIVGVITSFSLFTLSITTIVKITGISPDVFRYIAIGIIMFFGLTMIFPALDNFFIRITSWIARIGSSIEQTAASNKNDFFHGYILGTALGMIWTPCAGPILATIALVASTHGITLTTALMTLAYSCGAALPMFLILFGGNKIMQKTQALAPYMSTIKKICGVIVILAACAMAFNVDTQLQVYLSRYFPTLSIESNPFITKELKKLTSDNHGLTMNPMENAPELSGTAGWINSTPLSLQSLRSKVVLLDFWTYSCINCVRTLPYIKQWYADYKDKGLVIIGVHTPEFAFEKNIHNVESAAKKFNLTYPIVLDNDYAVWQTYNVHYWPTHVLIDQEGKIVSQHSGEGNYQETENEIRHLLGLQPISEEKTVLERMPITPEIYLGYARADNYSPDTQLYKDQPHTYEYKAPLQVHNVGLNGPWIIKKEYATTQEMCTLNLNFIAHHVYLVMESPTPQEISLLLDGKPVAKEYYTKDTQPSGTIIVHEPRMYEIVNLHDEYKEHTLTITLPKQVSVYTFTFG